MESYKDDIVEEVRRVRHAYAARFNFDLDKIFKDIIKKEKAERGFKFVTRVNPKKEHPLQHRG